MKRLLLPVLLLGIASHALGASAAQKFVDMLADSGDFIKAGKYAEALKLDETVIAQMGEHYVSGDATAQLLVIAMVHKALALAGLGREEEAIWFWHGAIGIYPAIARSDMSMFGTPGKFLAEHGPEQIVSDTVAKGAHIEPPKTVTRVEPKYPSASLRDAVQAAVVIECIIGTDGRVHVPHMTGDIPAPFIAYAALDALRQWRFTPATADGKPISVQFHITMNFKVR
jgi:TonB family protein